MKILIVNPIVYTSESRQVKRTNTIKDTMIYDLCLAFVDNGDDVTLAVAEDYKPMLEEDYPFDIVWMPSKLKKICFPNCLPYCPSVKAIAKSKDYDLIISSEIFSLNSLMLAIHNKKKLIVWHELAKHNAILKTIPSKIWYGIVAPTLMKNVRVVARSNEAKAFINKYCKNTLDTVIDHGVNLDLFIPNENKTNTFVICSQLIERKQIDGAIKSFSDFVKNGSDDYKLYIIGEGDQEQSLKELSTRLGMDKNIIFTGKLSHQELMPMLSSAKAMLVNTRKDNNMISIVESIAVGTPVLTTEVPLNAEYIKANKLGIAKDNWNASDLAEITENNAEYVNACLNYREELSTKKRVKQFLNLL